MTNVHRFRYLSPDLRKESDSRQTFFARLSTLNCMFDVEPDISVEKRRELRKEISDKYYTEGGGAAGGGVIE